MCQLDPIDNAHSSFPVPFMGHGHSVFPAFYLASPLFVLLPQCFRNNIHGLGIEAYTCNPSYSGGRDQEDDSFRLAGQKVPETPFNQ
jgi:hypothetical protein